jgi:hypothetical protein
VTGIGGFDYAAEKTGRRFWRNFGFLCGMLRCGEILIMFGGLRQRGKFEVNVGRCKMKILLLLDASRFPE